MVGRRRQPTRPTAVIAEPSSRNGTGTGIGTGEPVSSIGMKTISSSCVGSTSRGWFDKPAAKTFVVLLPLNASEQQIDRRLRVIAAEDLEGEIEDLTRSPW